MSIIEKLREEVEHRRNRERNVALGVSTKAMKAELEASAKAYDRVLELIDQLRRDEPPAAVAVDQLAAAVSRELPGLVIELSGPWPQDGAWLCNFKDAGNGFRYIHPGSSGVSMLDALMVGYAHIAKDRQS